MHVPILLLLAGLAQVPPAAPATPAAPVECVNVQDPLPPELSGWTAQTPVTAGVSPGQGATMTLGRAAKVALHPAQHLQLAPVPAKNGGAGGTLQIAIAEAGTYRIALGAAAWIDLIADGKAVASTAHTHGPPCSGVRKLVDFTLTPGTYTIQLSDSAVDSVAILVVKHA